MREFNQNCESEDTIASIAAASEPVDLGPLSPEQDKAFKVTPYDPAKDREITRGVIAYCLMGTLAMVVFLSF